METLHSPSGALAVQCDVKKVNVVGVNTGAPLPFIVVISVVVVSATQSSITVTVAVAERALASNARTINTRLDDVAGKDTVERTSPVIGSTVNSLEPMTEYMIIADDKRAITRPTT